MCGSTESVHYSCAALTSVHGSDHLRFRCPGPTSKLTFQVMLYLGKWALGVCCRFAHLAGVTLGEQELEEQLDACLEAVELDYLLARFCCFLKQTCSHIV